MSIPVESAAGWLQSRSTSASGMLLQKLLYYAQAWHLVWEGKVSELTHREAPWRAARAGLPDEAPSKTEISVELIRQTYAAHRYGSGKKFSKEYLRGLELMVELPQEELELLEKTVEPESTLKWLETGTEE